MILCIIILIVVLVLVSRRRRERNQKRGEFLDLNTPQPTKSDKATEYQNSDLDTPVEPRQQYQSFHSESHVS